MFSNSCLVCGIGNRESGIEGLGTPCVAGAFAFQSAKYAPMPDSRFPILYSR